MRTSRRLDPRAVIPPPMEINSWHPAPRGLGPVARFLCLVGTAILSLVVLVVFLRGDWINFWHWLVK